MEWIKQNGLETIKKYRFLLLILLLGMVLMALPEGKREEEAPPPAQTAVAGLQQELAEILSRVAGAGKVEVLLTEAAGAQTLYQTDEDSSQTESVREKRTQTVLITDADRTEGGLVRQVIPPKYQGAVVLCQGAEDARVRLALVGAVKSVTGLSSDKISVLKMK